MSLGNQSSANDNVPRNELRCLISEEEYFFNKKYIDNMHKTDLFWNISIIVSEESTTVVEKNRRWPHTLLKPWRPAARQLDLGLGHQLHELVKEEAISSYKSFQQNIHAFLCRTVSFWEDKKTI